MPGGVVSITVDALGVQGGIGCGGPGSGLGGEAFASFVMTPSDIIQVVVGGQGGGESGPAGATLTAGQRSGNGQVTITWTAP